MTCPNAARNFAISSRVPIETRTCFGIDGQVRPMTTFSLSSAGRDLTARAADVDHDHVRFRRQDGEPSLVEPLDRLFADLGDRLAALFDQALGFQAGDRSDHAGDRQAPAP